jgi:hypothetical protein
MEGNAVVRFEFLHVGDGRRAAADSSTRFPGASRFFSSQRKQANYDKLMNEWKKLVILQKSQRFNLWSRKV